MLQSLCDHGKTGNSSCHQKNAMNGTVSKLVYYVSSDNIHYGKKKKKQQAFNPAELNSKTLSWFLFMSQVSLAKLWAEPHAIKSVLLLVVLIVGAEQC